MSKVTITLHTDNSAFDEYPTEVARILRQIADATDEGSWKYMTAMPLSDRNGNRVGTVVVEEDE